MVLSIIICLFIVIIAAVSYDIYEQRKENDIEKMSFWETMNLTGLPIITFCQGQTKLNFILDTGSTLSIIDKSALKNITYTMINKQSSVTGLQGETSEGEACNITLYYKENNFNSDFSINDMTGVLSTIKQSTGVTIMGLLGSDFFDKYKYIIDFKEYKAYSKK